MKDNAKISADDLPWYLKESLDTADVDELDQDSLTFSRYTHTENAIIDEAMEESSPSQAASKFNSSARREKRPRTTIEYDNNPHFIPFTGTSEELIEFSKSDEGSTSIENISNFSFRRILEKISWEYAAFLTTAITVLICITFKFRRRTFFSQSSSQKSPRQQLDEIAEKTDRSVVTDDHLKLEIISMVSEDSADLCANYNKSISKSRQRSNNDIDA